MNKIKGFLLGVLLIASSQGLSGPAPSPDSFDIRFCINPTTANNGNALTAGDLPLSLGFQATAKSPNICAVGPSRTDKPSCNIDGSLRRITIPLESVTSSDPEVAPLYCTAIWAVRLETCRANASSPYFCTLTGARSTWVSFQVIDLNRLNAQGQPIVLTTLKFEANASDTFGGYNADNDRNAVLQARLIDFPEYVTGAPDKAYGYPRAATCALPIPPGASPNYCQKSPWINTCSSRNGDFNKICNYAYADIATFSNSAGTDSRYVENYKGQYSMNLILSGNEWLQSIGK
jgi:hypothetical protein